MLDEHVNDQFQEYLFLNSSLVIQLIIIQYCSQVSCCYHLIYLDVNQKSMRFCFLLHVQLFLCFMVVSYYSQIKNPMFDLLYHQSNFEMRSLLLKMSHPFCQKVRIHFNFFLDMVKNSCSLNFEDQQYSTFILKLLSYQILLNRYVLEFKDVKQTIVKRFLYLQMKSRNIQLYFFLIIEIESLFEFRTN